MCFEEKNDQNGRKSASSWHPLIGARPKPKPDHVIHSAAGPKSEPNHVIHSAVGESTPM